MACRRAAKVLLLTALLAALPACSGERKPAASRSALSKEPLSVRGWIADVDSGDAPTFRTVETESARRIQIFQSTNVWIDNAPFVSGGIAENGAFVLLDVPPGNVAIRFAAPGIPHTTLVLEAIPGNADVLIPSLVLSAKGALAGRPDAIRIRVPAKVTKPRTTAQIARVAGQNVPIQEVPARAMTDRRDYPIPPGFKPVAVVR